MKDKKFQSINRYLSYISILISLFKKFGIDGYIIPSNDEFQNEFVPENKKRLKALSGFSGSNGLLILKKTQDLLFYTDGRYITQANHQLRYLKQNSSLCLKIMNVTELKNLSQFFHQGEKLGYDPMLHSIANFNFFNKIANQNHFSLCAIQENLVDLVYSKQYPKQNKNSNNDSINTTNIHCKNNDIQSDGENITQKNKKIIFLNKKDAGKSPDKKFEDLINTFSHPQQTYLHPCKSTKAKKLLFLTSSHSLCWLLNIRGYDVPYSMLLSFYGILDLDNRTVTIFTKNNQYHSTLKNLSLHSNLKINIQNLSKTEIESFFQKYHQDIIKENQNTKRRSAEDLNKTTNKNKVKEASENINNNNNNIIVYLDPQSAPVALLHILENLSRVIPQMQVLLRANPISELQAIKNETEIQNIKQAHIEDAIAWQKFLKWLEINTQNQEIDPNINQNNHDNNINLCLISEKVAAEKLLSFQMESKNFTAQSFHTISGFAENSAIIHYEYNANTYQEAKAEAEVEAESNSHMHKDSSNNKHNKRNTVHLQKNQIKMLNAQATNSIYLCDAGVQYRYGTTDITRTIAIGKPSTEHKKYYTAVLKGHIDMAKAIFPYGTKGINIDALARQHLWRYGLDYPHSTGHGVGYFLSVHEGLPGSIGQKKHSDIELKVGMVLSIEPGLYFEEKYGIRLENLYIIENHHCFQNFLKFTPLTLVPFEELLILFEDLDKEQSQWLQKYHTLIKESLHNFQNPTIPQK